MDAARLAGVERFVSVSVLPESWRERDLGEEVAYYFAVKKRADIALSRSDLNWLILRPSLLLDGPATGTVSLGPAEFHGEISREDVAATLAELLHEPRIGRRTWNSTPVRRPSGRRYGRTSAPDPPRPEGLLIRARGSREAAPRTFAGFAESTAARGGRPS